MYTVFAVQPRNTFSLLTNRVLHILASVTSVYVLVFCVPLVLESHSATSYSHVHNYFMSTQIVCTSEGGVSYREPNILFKSFSKSKPYNTILIYPLFLLIFSGLARNKLYMHAYNYFISSHVV